MKSIDDAPQARKEEEKAPGDERLIMLCDGIFAIAITLLVIDIKIPPGLNEGDFYNALPQLFSQTLFYLITFIAIAGFWRLHRGLMRYIKRMDEHFISLTVLFLVFVAFFPVTSSIIGEGYIFIPSILMYTLGFAGCGFSLLLLWFYASWHHRLIDPEVTPAEIRSRSITFALAPTYFSLSLLLLFFLYPAHSSDVFWTWLLLPFLAFIVRRASGSTLAQWLGGRLVAIRASHSAEKSSAPEKVSTSDKASPG